MQLTLFLCVIYLLTMVGLSPSLVGPLCEWGKWKYSVGLLVGTICFPKGTNLHPYLWHYGADPASVPPSCCVSVSLAWQVSWWSQLHLAIYFLPKIPHFLLPFPPPPPKKKKKSGVTQVKSPWAETWEGHSLPYPKLGSKAQAWSCSSKLSGNLPPIAFLRPLLAQTLLASPWGATLAPTPCSECTTPATLAHSHGKLDTFPKPLDPAGTSFPPLGARRTFHYKFALVLHLSVGAAAGHCQTTGLAQYSSFAVSFNTHVWNRDESLEKLVSSGTPPCHTACLLWAYVWCRDETHSAGCESAAWRRLPAAREQQLMDQCCQQTLSPASWPVIGTWVCAVLL